MARSVGVGHRWDNSTSCRRLPTTDHTFFLHRIVLTALLLSSLLVSSRCHHQTMNEEGRGEVNNRYSLRNRDHNNQVREEEDDEAEELGCDGEEEEEGRDRQR